MESLKALDKALVERMHEGLLRIRLFEETQSRLFKAGEQEGFTHLYLGEEAIAVGACLALNRDDYITSTHRGHGHMIAKGGDFKKMFAELYGRSPGSCLGRSGSLHIADRGIGMLGANGLVGDGNPIAVGAGYSIRLRGTKQVVVSFFGDGASNQGTFHESLNMAASFDLPVIFVLENNGMSCGTLTASVCKVLQNLGDRAVAYGIPGHNIDGMDVVEVWRTVSQAVERARAGQGPTLVNCQTFRHHGHFEGDIDVRTPEQIKEAQSHDAVADFEGRMLRDGLATEKLIRERRERIQALVDEAVDFARAAPKAPAADAMKFVYAE
jgi:pyruvate dehydrogenase E1 component alpha subunit